MTDTSVSPILQLEARSPGGSSECISAGLEGTSGVRIPSFCTDTESVVDGEEAERSGSSGHSFFDNSTLLSREAGVSGGGAMLDSEEMLSGPEGEMHPLVVERALRLLVWKISGEENFLEEFHNRLRSRSKSQGHQKEQCWSTENGYVGVWSRTRIPWRHPPKNPRISYLFCLKKA